MNRRRSIPHSVQPGRLYFPSVPTIAEIDFYKKEVKR